MRELDRVRPDARPAGHPIARRTNGGAAAVMRELEHPTAELVEELPRRSAWPDGSGST